MKNLPYLLPLGLKVSTDTYSSDDIMSVEELSFYLRLDYEREPAKQRLLLPFDPANQEKIREALKGAAGSLANDLVRFGIEDLKILRKAGPLTGKLAHFEPVLTASGWDAQKVAFLEGCRALARGPVEESQVPAIVCGFESQLPAYLITACDLICGLAHREKIDAFEDDSEAPDELQYLIQMEDGAREDVLLAKKRVGTRDHLGNVDLLVSASLIIMGAPLEYISAALGQWPYVNPSPWRVDPPVANLWNNLLRRLKKSGWDNRS
jgi:hypothetical protein